MAGENIILVTPDYSNRELQTPATEHSVGAILREKLEPVIPASGTLATQGDITGLNDLSSGDVETAVGTALATYDGPTKAEMDAGFAGISLLSNQEKARLDLGFHDKYPLIETFQGYKDPPAIFAANNAITEAQISQQTSRYPGAVAWAYKMASGTAGMIIDAHQRFMSMSSYTTNGHRGAIGAYWPCGITTASYATWSPNDERLIFEAIVTPDANDRDTNVANWFFGLLATGVSSDWSSYDWGALTATVQRIGFASANTATKNMVALSDTSSGVTISNAFTPGINIYRHYKFVYDIGTDVKFYVNGVLQATITTNLPIACYMIPIFHTKRVTGDPLTRIYGVRCYFQNGA